MVGRDMTEMGVWDMASDVDMPHAMDNCVPRMRRMHPWAMTLDTDVCMRRPRRQLPTRR